MVSGCMHACSVAQSCLTLCDPMDCSPPGSSVHGILQAGTRVGCHALLLGIFLTQGLNWGLLYLLHLTGRFFITSAIWEAHGQWVVTSNCVFNSYFLETNEVSAFHKFIDYFDI